MSSKKKELEEEVRLLEAKVVFLEKVRDLQEAIRVAEGAVQKYIPWPYPVYPNYEPYPRIWWSTTTTAGRNWKEPVSTGDQL